MRRQPQQQRSRDMVERLLAAARAVLERDGYESFSTNRVATAAGVSPGSLYQYFPDKHALVSAVVDRHTAAVSEQAAAALADRIGESGPAMIRATAVALLDALSADPELLRVVTEELPLSRDRARRQALERRVRELVVAWLAARPGQTRSVDHARTAWVLVTAVEHLTVRYVLDAPPIARDDFLDEVVVLCSGYLGPSPGPVRR
ncbi:TetR/AcrR family transcriptional regulator [Nocardioides sp. C4-1]|uniref:TetR/AcrR family transcriptional regulator n=1 Tax=Nocardioides sp. C4-1 TaxID=3151851 RepID=UPI003265F825